MEIVEYQWNDQFLSRLSRLEQEVFKLCIQQYPYDGIVEALEKIFPQKRFSKESVGNALVRLHLKAMEDENWELAASLDEFMKANKMTSEPDIRLEFDIKPLIELEDGGCTLAGLGRGDCEHAIGLPGRSIPGVYDGFEYGKPKGWCWSCWKSNTIIEFRREVKAWREVADAFGIGNIARPPRALTADVPQDVVSRDNVASKDQLISDHTMHSVTLKFNNSTMHSRSVPVTGSNLGCLENIAKITSHDAPAIYDSSMIEAINYMACTALGWKVTPSQEWSHNEPNSVMQTPTLAEQALEKLSGDLSHDNVAAVKQILKKIID